MQNKLPLLVVVIALLAGAFFAGDSESVVVVVGDSVADKTEAVTREYLGDVAVSFDQLSKDAAAGKYKTNIEAAAASKASEEAARNKHKQAMARIMQPELGDEDLPATAPKTYSEISQGFQRVAK